jgi:transcriptional regulator GlxA family with amidase domain
MSYGSIPDPIAVRAMTDMERLIFARLLEAREALIAAAMSLETIAAAAGSRESDELLREMSQVRGYAASRARVARAALAACVPPEPSR